MPAYLANQLCTDINGYFGTRSTFDADDMLVDLSQSSAAVPDAALEKGERGIALLTDVGSRGIWFRCLIKVVLSPNEARAPDGKDYWWYEMAFFARWCHPQTSRVLYVGTPSNLRHQLEGLLGGRPAGSSRGTPFRSSCCCWSRSSRPTTTAPGACATPCATLKR